MRVEYDRNGCEGWFQCLQHWDAFEMNMGEGKADLKGSSEREDGLFVRDVPGDVEEDVINAAEACPANVIYVYEDDEQIAP